MIYPVTIMQARYGGVYEGGEWVAFHLHPSAISSAAWGDDVACADFFHRFAEYGRGVTPDDALRDLERRLTVVGKA